MEMGILDHHLQLNLQALPVMSSQQQGDREINSKSGRLIFQLIFFVESSILDIKFVLELVL